MNNSYILASTFIELSRKYTTVKYNNKKVIKSDVRINGCYYLRWAREGELSATGEEQGGAGEEQWGAEGAAQTAAGGDGEHEDSSELLRGGKTGGDPGSGEEVWAGRPLSQAHHER